MKHLFFAAFMSCCISLHAMEKQKEQSLVNDFLKPVLQGAVLGISEVTANQPLAYVKVKLQNATQQPSALQPPEGNRLLRVLRDMLLEARQNPFALYRGYGVNAASMAPITAIQVAAYETVAKLLASEDAKTHVKRKLTTGEKMFAAFFAGGLSALVSCPAELTMQHQMETKERFYKTLKTVIRERGVEGLYKGFTLTLFRDGGFTTGYLALASFLRELFGIQTGSDFKDAVLSGVPAGFVAATVTQPCDTVKTRWQLDLHGTKFKRLVDVAFDLFQTGSWQAFYKGFTARTTRIASAVTLMSWLKEKMSQHDKPLAVLAKQEEL